MTLPTSDLARFLRAYRRFLEHAARAAELTPADLRAMRESGSFFSVGSENPARVQATAALEAVRGRVARLAERLPRGSLQLIEGRRLVIQEAEARQRRPEPRPLATPVVLFPAAGQQP